MLKSDFFESFGFCDFYRGDEEAIVKRLTSLVDLSEEDQQSIFQNAKSYVEKIRQKPLTGIRIENFLQHYHLSSEEGIVLMCLAEALLRVPDKITADLLIEDKISSVDWLEDTNEKSGNFFVNAATWGLALTGKVMSADHLDKSKAKVTMQGVVRRMSAPVVRQMMRQAMRLLGGQFITGTTIENAISNSRPMEEKGYNYSYDMLGEAAYTSDDAKRYFASYRHAVEALGKSILKDKPHLPLICRPSISVKLSALHPRYDLFQKESVLQDLYPKIKELCLLAKDYEVPLTIDAEESERLELSLVIIEELCKEKALNDWQGLGLAVQAYQKRATSVIDWLIAKGKQYSRRFNVRLVKGAYWDSEIKRSQERGLEGYPVFTRKHYTDLSYLACAQKMLRASGEIYPQFATHNAFTVACIFKFVELMKVDEFEFQRLHGMGEQLYDLFVSKDNSKASCRIYAPVGDYHDLLPYLVRRLLENGANTSFIHQLTNPAYPIDDLLENPIQATQKTNSLPHSKIVLPRHLYGEHRMNSKSFDLSNLRDLSIIENDFKTFFQKKYKCQPFLGKAFEVNGTLEDVTNPATGKAVGLVLKADAAAAKVAVDAGIHAFEAWSNVDVEERAKLLEKTADLLERDFTELMYLAVVEAGKTLSDAIAEVREAIDFCRYYAVQARHDFKPLILQGPTGERNELTLMPRGVFVCISPWNFPLAIFLGQVCAALASGNCVISKPADQTPLIAHKAVELLLEAGVPQGVVQLVPGRGSVVGATLIADERIAGVAFTGSNETANMIQETLIKKKGPIVPFIAETGGINAMIVDSSALPEQVVRDVLTSAFQSAGQRCSALRLLCLQEDIFDRVMTMLQGALQELTIGDPSDVRTDIGPVIDKGAQKGLQSYADEMVAQGKLLFKRELSHSDGSFVAPHILKINKIAEVTREIFGPILHVVTFKAGEMEDVIEQINELGYGLTMGLHTRIDKVVSLVRAKAKVGNLYVNRNMIGAVVGVQPFGGEGLSGTGPKAGGPHYLHRFATERTFTQDITAAGGNVSLLSLN